MKKLLLTVGLLAAVSGTSHAQSAWDKGYSTWTVVGVICTTGTAVQLNATRQIIGFTIGGYRINNLDSADAVYIGHDLNVSTHSATTVAMNRLGERVNSGSSVSYEIGHNPDLSDQPDVEVWCRAVDAAGAGAVLLNLVTFGYK